MIVSMTGYGSAQACEAGVAYCVEIRSLNNRYYKATIKLPEPMQSLDVEVDKWLRGSLGRGSVTYVLRIRDESPISAYSVNVQALQSYLEGLKQVAADGFQRSVDLAAMLALPGVCQPPQIDETVWHGRKSIVQRLTQSAVSELLEMRRAEGEALREHLLEQCRAIRAQLAAVASRAPVVIEEYQQRLRSRVDRLLSQAQLNLDQDTLIREVAVFADRCDISEEVARLGSHLDQFLALCDSSDEAGRKLEFLIQEMLREANTIGSKSNDTLIARQIVEMKGAIDRLKEQVQNVE